MPEMEPVSSSNIDQIGYDDALMELHILFRNTSQVYVYQDVSVEIFQGLKDADSKGSFFNREIKNVYKYEKR